LPRDSLRRRRAWRASLLQASSPPEIPRTDRLKEPELQFLALLGIATGRAGGTFADQFTVPNTEAQQAIDCLHARFLQQAGDSARVVIKAKRGLRTPEMRARVAALVRQLHALPDVVAVTSPYALPGSISHDGTIAQLIV
jgi:putative drug exporter of the RND superfamily